VTIRPKVLVTGAAGFIGSHVLTALRSLGADPVALVRPGSPVSVDATSIEGDYHDADTVTKALQAVSPTSLVHAAWRLMPGSGYLDDPTNVDELRASLQLFRLAHDAGCRRIVGIGTCLEYAESRAAVSEDAPLRPTTLYGASKAALFLTAQTWASVVGASFCWARLYFPFGPREPAHRLVPMVVNGLLRGERVATTEGSQLRSFLFIEDVADALAAMTLSNVTGAVNVGSADAIAVRDVVERLASVIGRADLLDVGARAPRPGDPEVLVPDITLLNTVVDWRPKRSLDAALQETVAWWRTAAATPG
jgi:nucleoside-diphosphate-sugar epimerase